MSFSSSPLGGCLVEAVGLVLLAALGAGVVGYVLVDAVGFAAACAGWP